MTDSSPLRSRLTFGRYPEYRDSGIERFGDIPAHWRLARLGYLSSIGNGSTPRRENHEYWSSGTHPWLTSGKINDGVIEAADEFVTDQAMRECHLPIARAESVLVAITGEGKTRGRTAQLRIDSAISQHLAFIEPNGDGIDSSFLWRFLESHYEWLRKESSGGGSTRAALTCEFLRSVQILVPPLKEQRRIAGFLDRETAKIDALVAKKEELIELLQEKRAALITHAVAKGLDPNVPMKDSGIEWLGDIPAHWRTKKLKTVSSVQTGVTLGKKYDNVALEARPYLRVANVQDGYLDLEEITDIELPAGEVGRYELQAGDVLMTEGGDFDKLGRGYVWDGQIRGCLHQNHIFAVRPQIEKLRPRFLSTVLSSSYGRAYFTATSKQATNLASTNSTKLGNFPVPLPAPGEQDEILKNIGCQVDPLDLVQSRARQGLRLLNELRTALISAAVTGKIDVRAASAEASASQGGTA